MIIGVWLYAHFYDSIEMLSGLLVNLSIILLIFF